MKKTIIRDVLIAAAGAAIGSAIKLYLQKRAMRRPK